MANKLPNFLTEYIPYSRLVRRRQGFRQSVASYMERSRALIGDAYDVDYDKVQSIFLKAWDKSEKDYPSPSIITPQNIKEYDTFNKYCLFLWEYYVVDKSKPKEVKPPPKVPEERIPDIPQAESEGEFEGYGDEDDLLSMGNLGAKKKTGGLQLYEGVKETDSIGEEEIDERILRLLGLDFIGDIDYATYSSLLKEWSVAARMADSKVSTEEAELVTNEFRRVKSKVGRFKINKKVVNRGEVSPIKKAAGFITGSPPDQPPLLPPGDDGGNNPPRKPTLLQVVISIRKTCDSILKMMENQLKGIRNQVAKDRKIGEKTRRGNREKELEKTFKRVTNLTKKILTPTVPIIKQIMDFIGKVLLGRILVKLVDYISDPKNQEKINSLLRFIGDWFPALLAGFFLFANPLGIFVRKVVGTAIKTTFFLAKKGIPALLRFIKANPLKSAAVLIPTLAAMGAVQQANTPAADPKEAAEGKTQLNDTLEMGGATGDPMSVLGTLAGGGQVGRYNGGGKVPPMKKRRRTQPAGGKVTSSTGKRVRGAGKDTQMIVAQPGEVVISKKAVDKFGAPFFLNLNKAGGGTNIPSFSKLSDLSFMQGGGVVAPNIDMGRVMQTLRDAYITPDDLGPAGPDNPRIQNVANYLYGMEKLNTEGLDVFQIEDLQIAKKSYPKMDKKTKRGSTSFASRSKTEDKEKKPKAKSRPMGRSAAKMRMEKGNQETMGEPDTKTVTESTKAPFVGAITPTSTAGVVAPAPTVKPAKVARIPKSGMTPPPPPEAGVNVTTISQKIPQQGGGGSSPSGDREIEDFDVKLPNSTRMMNIQIYGLLGVN